MAFSAVLTGTARTDPRSITNSTLTLATGWSLVVNTGLVVSEGANVKRLVAPTITLNGSGRIEGLYETTVGPNSRVRFNNLV